MSWIGDKVDTNVSAMAERVARRINRRDALRGAVLGGATSLAALAIGEQPALAQDCVCGPTRRCASCSGVGCPEGYRLCKSTNNESCFNGQGYRCEWPSGTWIACMGMGKGYGYKVCYDCIGHGGCEDWCTCLSDCICCHCRTADDVRAEQRRIQAHAALTG